MRFGPAVFMASVIASAAIVTGPAPSGATPVGTTFTYQGTLTDGAAPANGAYDLRFVLWDAEAGGLTVGSPIEVSDAVVTEGLFTQSLDFGAGVFTGEARWLEIGVRPGTSVGAYTQLARQRITAVPVALYAPLAGSANGLTCSGCVSAGALAPGAVTSALIGAGTIQQTNLAFSPVLTVGAAAPLSSSGGQNPIVSLTMLPVANGGTGAPTAAAARTNLGAAASGANTDITSLAGVTDAGLNTRVGAQALNGSVTGQKNTAVGSGALSGTTSASWNTAIGEGALALDTTGAANTAVGQGALAKNQNGGENTAVGGAALSAIQAGNNRQNTAVGSQALAGLATGNGNIAIGRAAGATLTSGSRNIYIDNAGAAAESNAIRIGDSAVHLAGTYIAGISGAEITGGKPVVVSASGRLGVAAAATLPAGTPRFVDNGDGTLTDTKTGLMWEKKRDDGGIHDKDNKYTWSTGTGDPNGTVFTVFLAKLNDTANGGANCFAGYCDWRLPAHLSPGPAELETLLDVTAGVCGGGVGVCAYPALEPTSYGFYSSSTTYAATPGYVWFTAFYDWSVAYGNAGAAPKTQANYARAVRNAT